MKSYMPTADKRRLAGGAELPSSDRHRHVRELLRINADLARLGNLLKLGIVEEALDHGDAMALIGDIRKRQAELKIVIKRM